MRRREGYLIVRYRGGLRLLKRTPAHQVARRFKGTVVGWGSTKRDAKKIVEMMKNYAKLGSKRKKRRRR